MSIFFQPWFLWSVVAANAIGTVWGGFWYWEQLAVTPWYLLPVVPDSPLHAMLFGIYIYWLLTGGLERCGPGRQLVAWAGVLGGIKYGLWTTVIISQYLLTQGVNPGIEDWLLYFSHGGMAVQGLVYAGRLPRVAGPALTAVVWLGLNDAFDYILLTHPRLPLADQVAVAGWTNVMLTILVAALAVKLLYDANKTARS
jgi:uncharacterized membrane protein YpjA